VSGSFNTAIGDLALANNNADANTAVGSSALSLNTTGNANTAVGSGALLSNIDGFSNTGNGPVALQNNTSGTENTANGAQALFNNRAGADNTAMGSAALFHNTTASQNTATGVSALFSNTTGVLNTATGDVALAANTTGNYNTADGAFALWMNIEGVDNTAVGGGTLYSNTTGSNNTALGNIAGANLTTGDNNIDIGYNVMGVAGESNTTRIGNTDIADTFIRGISGTTVASGATVLVASNGHLGTVTSSKRFKDEIKPMDEASEALYSLKPVTFRYKKEIDPAGTQQFGLVAEDVEKVNSDLVVRDEHGNVNSVRYEQINAMLLNEFLKEHKRVQELNATVAKQETTIAQQRKDFEAAIAQQQKDFRAVAAEHEREIQALTATVNEQASQIQKVSAALGTSEPRSQMVLNNR